MTNTIPAPRTAPSPSPSRDHRSLLDAIASGRVQAEAGVQC